MSDSLTQSHSSLLERLVTLTSWDQLTFTQMRFFFVLTKRILAGGHWPPTDQRGKPRLSWRLLVTDNHKPLCNLTSLLDTFFWLLTITNQVATRLWLFSWLLFLLLTITNHFATWFFSWLLFWLLTVTKPGYWQSQTTSQRPFGNFGIEGLPLLPLFKSKFNISYSSYPIP